VYLSEGKGCRYEVGLLSDGSVNGAVIKYENGKSAAVQRLLRAATALNPVKIGASTVQWKEARICTLLATARREEEQNNVVLCRSEVGYRFLGIHLTILIGYASTRRRKNQTRTADSTLILHLATSCFSADSESCTPKLLLLAQARVGTISCSTLYGSSCDNRTKLYCTKPPTSRHRCLSLY
jgi:hypothetical protein